MGFAALALALAPALPASAQPFEERSDGRIDAGGLSVGVFADVSDAQTAKLEQTTYTGPGGETTATYLPAKSPPSGPALGATPGSLTAGDFALLHDPRVAPRPTLYEGVLYVSNNPDAYNTLLITAVAADVTATEEGCAVADVRSTSGDIAVQMAGTADGHYQAFLRILDAGPEKGHASDSGPSCGDYAAGVNDADTATVLADHRSRVTVRVRGADTVQVRVDGEGPAFSTITPEGETASHAGRITFEVHDRDSGLRHDGELVITPDGDYREVNADGDNETFQEPLSLPSGGLLRVNGNAADIDLQVSRLGTNPHDAPDITNAGDWEMLGDRPGVAYFFSADADFLDVGRHLLGLRALDRVGNVTETGSVHGDALSAVMQAWTGIAFDHERDMEVADRSWIMLDFGEPVNDMGIVINHIRVVDHQVTRVVHSHAAPDKVRDITEVIVPPVGSARAGVDPRSRLYVRLAQALQADETPEVIVLGGALQDIAGNPNEPQVIVPKDGIAPRFTVRIMAAEEGADPDFTEQSIIGAPEGSSLVNGIIGATAGRPLVNGKGSFVVDVMADEELADHPLLYFTGIRVEADAENTGPDDEYIYTLGEGLRMGSPPFRHDEEQHWRRTYMAKEFRNFDGLFGLVIVGEDAVGNTGVTSGWTPKQHQRAEPPALGDALDLEGMDKARLLLEVDRRLNGGLIPEEHVTFRRYDDDETETDLFVRLAFSGEGKEYERGGFMDSYGTVTITEITLDGEDAMRLLTRLSSGAFELLAHNPGESHHNVEYRAVDEAGNERFFDVQVHPLGAPEPPYEVRIHPGWNLVSFPGTPAQTALRDVMPATGFVTPVLSYQDGDWRSAVLGEDGSWRGRLEEIVAGYGYWMFSIAPQTIAVPIPAQERRETLTSVPVTHGWNLLGVVDLFHNPQGEPPGPEDGNDGEADHYFASVPWRMAYTYDTPNNRWVRLTPNGDGTSAANGNDSEPPEIVNGKGYWVWSEEPSTLVP